MILLIDNYDSFVHNLARYFSRWGQATRVVRNDSISIDEIRLLQPAAIVLSPGPCTPSEAGISLQVVQEVSAEFPLLGVCLGHQAIAQAAGGVIARAPEPMHGRTSEVFHAGEGLFAGLPTPMTACRYHSLVVDEDTLPSSLQVTARTADGIIMAVQHRDWPVYGVQFHPEAILTQGGFQLIGNFLRLANVPYDESLELADELPATEELPYDPPQRPVTF